ncbi:unnamed protein product [Protopolystoma xenopodis]|uniref:Dynein heavy chain ATP-binding dynein motor region domain-containing protein n=1 Tax=Protopolystoma xenopodis TaxID=117903 RepID=A0A448X2Q8_9PLAT|nr:unnamed protein product [Protopolystoma xenopodis]
MFTLPPFLDHHKCALSPIDDNGRDYVLLGDREIDIDPGFRIYLVSKLPNPKFSANLFSRAAVINYTVTLIGLEGQLLSTLVKQEQRELEERRELLIIESRFVYFVTFPL